MNTTTVAIRLEDDLLAVVRKFAQDQGYPSTSSALRRIIDEWRMMKAKQLRLLDDACCDEERAAVAANQDPLL